MTRQAGEINPTKTPGHERSMMSETLLSQLREWLRQDLCSDETVYRLFLERIAAGRLTREEEPLTHLCVYFAAYDPAGRKAFLGHHKKSGLWLFTGGHVDPGETLAEAVSREISEEWGLQIPPLAAGEPAFFTITTILQPHLTCREHYDAWFFFPVEGKQFQPDPQRLAEEFHQIRWMSIAEALSLATDPNTRRVLGRMEKLSLV